MKLPTILTICIILVATIATIFVYPLLPTIIPSHWNAIGEVDGYSSRNAHVIMFGVLTIGFPLLLTYIPRLDPKYKAILEIKEKYTWFIFLFTLFMAGLYTYTTLFALGVTFPIQYFMFPALSLLFWGTGNLLTGIKQNYTVGIRIPWTLNSEKNWDLTHRLASKTFSYGAIAMTGTLLLGKHSMWGLLFIIVCMVLIPAVYSYTLNKKGI